MTRQLIIFGLVAALVIVLIFIGTYYLGRRTASLYIVPIMRLAARAHEFGEGKWDFTGDEAALQRKDEIGTLFQAFSRMSQQLKDLFSRLEQRVTELKRAQGALKESEEHYRSLFDGIPMGLYRTSPDGTIIDANPMLAQMLGYPDRETFMLIRAENMYMDPGDRAIWRSRMEKNGLLQSYDLRMRKYDGTEVWVESHSRAVRDEQGNVLYYEGSLKDTTERRLSQAALKKSEESYRALYEESKRAEEVYRSLINSSADAIVIYDLRGDVRYISPMFTNVFGWDAEELTGQQIPFLPESEKESTEAMIRDVVEYGRPRQGFETRRFTKDGRIIEVSMSASRYDDHEGQPAGMLVILRDISDKKRLEAQLQHAERMEAIGTLAGGIAHDFNNLLMVIQGYISLMLQGADSSHPNYENFKNIETQVRRGANLTSQLLGYARKGRYEVKPLNLNDIIKENMETFRRTRKDIVIHCELAPDLFPIEVDSFQIEQVLMNLYINAFDAMANGGDLFLITRNVLPEEIVGKIHEPKPGNYVMLTVIDSGVGMDKKTMDRIFEPFFTTKDMDKGTGLGLASVYGIVKGHGGYINVDSEPGKGATFNIYFPASDKTIVEIQNEPKKALKGKGTLLLVDDEELVLDVGARMLEVLGYTLIKAQSSHKAIEIYKELYTGIDLIILDMIMPDISGSQAFDLFRKINPDAAILLSSGYSIDGKATEILNKGCRGFIQKPFSIEEISEKIKKIIKE